MPLPMARVTRGDLLWTEPMYSVLQTEPSLTLTAVQTPSDLDWSDPLFLALVLRIGYS